MVKKRLKFLSNDNWIPLILLLFCIVGLLAIIFIDKDGTIRDIELGEFTEGTLTFILTVLCVIVLIPLVWLFFKKDKKVKK